jgi:hypothetical protein
MNVGVAVGATVPDIGKDQLDMALHAVQSYVHSLEGIPGT